MYVFGHQAPLQAIRDRYGNETKLTWSSTNFFGVGTGNLMRVTSPSGRWIQFTYDGSNRITQAEDNIGRIVTYIYGTSGFLAAYRRAALLPLCLHIMLTCYRMKMNRTWKRLSVRSGLIPRNVRLF